MTPAKARGCSDNTKPQRSLSIPSCVFLVLLLQKSKCLCAPVSSSAFLSCCVLFSGSTDPSTARVFPVFRGEVAVWLGAGRRDFPHGADTILVSGLHVGYQLSYSCTPPGSRSYFRLPENPATAQH